MENKMTVFILFSLFWGYHLEFDNMARNEITTSVEKSPNVIGSTIAFHCPYVSHCLFNYSLPLTDSNDSLHRPCCTSCNSTENYKMECCRDVMPCTLPSATPTSQQKVCIPLILENRYYENGILSIATCKEGGDEKERAKCLQEYDTNIVDTRDVIPVTDIHSFEIYRNIHCALCNGLNKTNVKYWPIRVLCKWTSNVDVTSYSDMLRVVGENSACAITYENPFPAIAIQECDYVIDSCNVTGFIADIDHYFLHNKQVCEGCPSCSYQTSYSMTFKNYGCARCNGIGLGQFAEPIPEFPAFSAVLDIDHSQERGTQRPTVCRSGTVFFQAKDICVEARCSLMRRLQDNTCEKTVHLVESFTYKIVFRLMLEAHINLQTGFGLVKQIGEILKGLLHSVFNAIADILYEVLLVADTKMYNSTEALDIKKSKLLWLEIRTKLNNMERQDPEKKLQMLLRLSAENKFSVVINQQVSFITLVVKDDIMNGNGISFFGPCPSYFTRFELCLKLNMSNITEVLKVSENIVIVPYYSADIILFSEFYDKPISYERNILEFKSCPFLQVLQKDLHWNETPFGLQFIGSRFFLSFSEFVYGENDGIIWVCMETYQALHSAGDSGSGNVLLGSCFNLLLLVLRHS